MQATVNGYWNPNNSVVSIRKIQFDSSICAYAFNSLRKKSSARGRWTMAFKDFNLIASNVT